MVLKINELRIKKIGLIYVLSLVLLRSIVKIGKTIVR